MKLTHGKLNMLGVAALLAAFSTTTQAETFRWAGTTDPQTMDPHAGATGC